MARLPQPGGDSGNWGDILNEYLSQAHKPDGTIKDDAISAAAIQNSVISESLLDSGVTTKLNNPVIPDGAVTNAKVATNAAIDADKLVDGTTNKLMSSTEKNKLESLTGKIADAPDFSATNPSVGQALAVSSISGSTMTGVGVINVLSDTATKTDNSVGLINWMNNSASGYLLHLVNGPNTTASNAALAIGTDRGAGAGLLISHKNTGIGISMGVQPGAGMGMQIAGRSTSFPLRVQLHSGSGAVSLRATTGANFSDGSSTSGSTTFTSATANFTAADIGVALTQLTSRGATDPMGSIPAGTTIVSVQSTTSITMSAAATATGTGVLFMVDGRAVSNTQNMLIIQDENSATLTAVNKTGINIKGADIASAPLKVSRKAGQTSPIFEVRDESSNPLTYIGKNGHITTTVTTALAASDIGNSTIGMYYDPTPGSQKLVLAGKDSSGTFNTGQIPLGASSGDTGLTGPVSSLTTGKYYGPSGVSISASAPTQSRLRTHMVYFDAAITVDRIGSDVTTAAASSILRWVIYQDNDGYPGTLVLDTGAVGDSTTTGWKETTINQTLAAGKYWFGCIAQGGNPTLRSSSGSIAMPGVGLSSTEVVSLTGAAVGYFIDNITGLPPSNFTAGASATAVSPLVWVRKA